MSKIPFRKPVVAVHWGLSTVDYVVADRKSGQVRITAAGSVSWAAEEGDDRSPGDVLLAELQRLGLRRLDLVVALGRGSVDVIPLQLPPAGDDELPVLVANQVMRDAGEIAETGVVDYVAIPADADQPRTGFAFAVDAATIEQVNAEAAKAALKPSAIVYRPLASVTLLQRVVPQSQQTMILVTLHDREADISIVRGGGLAYTRTARLSETRNVGDIAAQLAVALKAMCVNSLEALAMGGKLEISATGADPPLPSAAAKITVRDNGPGIPPEVRRHLFDPYYSGREAGRGLGLGLSKCWRIVQLHGGQIDVMSDIDGGTSFIISLPGDPEPQRAAS